MKNKLLIINQYVCKEDSSIRDEECLDIIIKSMSNCLNSNNMGDKYIKECLKCGALIKLLQPFGDGNHRTGLIVFGMLLENKGFVFDLNSAFRTMEEHKLNLPTIYSIEDDIANIEKYKTYITYPNLIKK